MKDRLFNLKEFIDKTYADMINSKYLELQSVSARIEEIEAETSKDLDMTKELTAQGENEIDKLIDQKMVEEFHNVREDENVIFDSRLAWHFLDKTFNIFIVVSPYQAATRTYLTRKSEDESYDSLEEAIEALVERRVLENKRYKSIYGINCEDLNNYVILFFFHL